MVKPKLGRRASDVDKNADPRARKTNRRPSGHQHRKKAEARRTTHQGVRGLLDFASSGIAPVPARLRLTCEDSPALAAVRANVTACLERFQIWRKKGRTEPDAREVTEAHNWVSPAAKEGHDVMLLIGTVYGRCHQLLGHLQEEDRWRNVYRCRTCRAWFYAMREPISSRPYCGKGCWPSVQYVPSERPRARVQTRKK